MSEEEKKNFYEDVPIFMHHCPHMYIMQQNMRKQQMDMISRQNMARVQKSEPGSVGDTINNKSNNNTSNNNSNSNNNNNSNDSSNSNVNTDKNTSTADINSNNSNLPQNDPSGPQINGPQIMSKIMSDPDTVSNMETLAKRVAGNVRL